MSKFHYVTFFMLIFPMYVYTSQTSGGADGNLQKCSACLLRVRAAESSAHASCAGSMPDMEDMFLPASHSGAKKPVAFKRDSTKKHK